MQSAKDYLRADAARLLSEAEAITDLAKTEGRVLTIDERSDIESKLADHDAKRAEIGLLEQDEKVYDEVDRMKGLSASQAAEAQAQPDALSVGDAFVKSDAFKAIKSGRLGRDWSTGSIEVPDFGFKANVTEALSPIVQPNVLGGIQQAAAVALRELTVADMLMQGRTDSNAIKYLQETTNTNAAAPVTEAATKPESTITFTQVSEDVSKVATFLPVSDEMLEDVSQIRSYLDNRLALFVRHEEENQLLNGTGTPPALRGILQRVGLQTGTRSALGVTTGETAGSTTIGNAIYAAITAVRVNALVEPDGIVMHPTNWSAARLAKDTAGQYLGGGPLMGAYGNTNMAGESMWGLPVVVTSRIAVNTALVGAFGTMAQVFYRNGLTVEASNSHSTFFKENLTAIRAERRLALAVYRPSAFHAITALATP